uniref:Amine oxidase n=1 Tax=Panthera tigris altaica TaxID=74533 RepID=A0A8C9JTU5_PANTA
MNQKTTLVLLALAVITIFALVCVLLAGRGGDGGEPGQPPHCPSVSPSAQPRTPPSQSQLFADLSPEELTAVMSFLTQQLGPGLVDAAQARPSDNCVFSVELQLPPKAADPAPPDRGNQLIFDRELPQAAGLLHHCCFYKRQGRNLVAMNAAPQGLQSGDRATWFGLYYNISGAGFFLHPVGLELLVDHRALEPAHWTIQKVFFQGRYYESLAQLEDQFEAGLVNVVLIPDNGTGGSWSLKSQVPRGPSPPLQFHPQGPRFSVQGSQVASSLWTFSFGLGAFSGPRIFDIRFRGERLAYEISLQEALAIYGGNSPAALLTRYIDGNFGMGKYSTPLTRGVDCPYLATYVDWHFLLESQAPKTMRDAICVFEQNQGLPLRRHHSNFYSHYFGGLAETVLVLRSVSTLLNYDYLWDMVFHSSGAIEVRFHATGYISSAFLFGAARRYGNQVGEHTLGTVHTHSAHFKVDLDVAGLENWVWAEDMSYVPTAVPWSPEHQMQRLQVDRKPVYEADYARTPGPVGKLFKGLRSFRGKVGWQGGSVHTGLLEEAGMSFAKAGLRIIFLLPCQDLVAWVTAGFLHIPHAEDIPNTVTVGNGVGFFLRPYNFFDQDPSFDSPDSVYFRGDQDAGACEVNPMACLPQAAACAPDLPAFSHGGFSHS